MRRISPLLHRMNASIPCVALDPERMSHALDMAFCVLDGQRD
jgi:hypothetical protein